MFRSLARKGFDLIIGTSFGYMDPMATVATDFPNQTFLHLTGYKSNGKNFGNLMGAMEDMKYLAGMLAGSRAKVDKTPKLGYMATFPIPEELRLGNAFMLGAKKTCPECTMDVRWINTWHDPVKEKDAAASLFDAGADVVLTGADTPAVADVAQAKGKWGITYDHYSSCKVDHCLTTIYWIWGPAYANIADAGRRPRPTRPATSTSTPTPGPRAVRVHGRPDAPAGHQGPAGRRRPAGQGHPGQDAAPDTGKTTRFDIVFAGPIKDNTGKEILAAGQKLEQADLDQFPPGPRRRVHGLHALVGRRRQRHHPHPVGASFERGPRQPPRAPRFP